MLACTNNWLKAFVFVVFFASVPQGWAADTATKPSGTAPDLEAVRAKIKAKEFKPAIVDLSALVDGGVQHPDVFSLLGFSYRKSGDRTNGALFYRKALDLDPLHKGALEYQGEMFVEMGDLPKARANLAKLAQLCPSGCEEREDLEKDIKEAMAKRKKR
jgi:Flp pilus assembly protein TadD